MYLTFFSLLSIFYIYTLKVATYTLILVAQKHFDSFSREVELELVNCQGREAIV